ncbi:hypothetical protein MKZ38_008265 [Zalerion maritima]|uniref:Uncharacterized protein n=1 Tax=Zalerion maritima TaxID=339359 RepID=A0AAD5S2J0_9PEZI|nr:hypothetical protein MKZ38_008265 [Zalerion maritima]
MLPTITLPPMGAKRHSFISTTSSSDQSSSDEIAITPCHTPYRAGTPAPSTPSTTPQTSRPQTPSLQHYQQSKQQQPHHEWNVSSQAEEYSPFKELMYAPQPGRKSGPPDAETLWNRMLLVQMCCGVYNSARLNAAIDSADFERFMPPRSTLDIMNDCVVITPQDVQRLKVGLEIKENKLKKCMPPAWKLH